MRNREDIVAYLERASQPHAEVAPGTWIVRDPSRARENIVVRLHDDFVLFRLRVLELHIIQPSQRETFFAEVLMLNASEMVHGAYGIADSALMLTHSMRVENLDFSEFLGTLDDFTLAVTKHLEKFAAFRKGEE